MSETIITEQPESVMRRSWVPTRTTQWWLFGAVAVSIPASMLVWHVVRGIGLSPALQWPSWAMVTLAVCLWGWVTVTSLLRERPRSRVIYLLVVSCLFALAAGWVLLGFVSSDFTVWLVEHGFLTWQKDGTWPPTIRDLGVAG